MLDPVEEQDPRWSTTSHKHPNETQKDDTYIHNIYTAKCVKFDLNIDNFTTLTNQVYTNIYPHQCFCANG